MRVSDDGLLKSHSIETDGFVDLYNKFSRELEKKQEQLVVFLRHVGIKMAHPDDGWVNRNENILSPAYPLFDDKPEIGDLIYLGWPSDKRGRIVRVKQIDDTMLSCRKRYFFEELTTK